MNFYLITITGSLIAISNLALLLWKERQRTSLLGQQLSLAVAIYDEIHRANHDDLIKNNNQVSHSFSHNDLINTTVLDIESPRVVDHSVSSDNKISSSLYELEASIANQSPEWCKQIDTALVETDHAVAEAIERFMSIAERAAQTSQEAHSALTGENEGSLFALASDTNRIVDQFLEHIHDSTNEINRLSSHITETLSISKSMYMLLDELEKIHNQTNLLSLNASVEAARCGVQNSGFGVVAQELRKLSLRSEVAAGRLRNLTQELNTHSSDLQTGLKTVVAVCLEHACETKGESIALMKDIDIAGTRTQEAVVKLTQLADHVGTDIGKVVTLLQFQDLLRQRLEHVSAPLKVLRDQSKRKNSSENYLLSASVNHHSTAVAQSRTVEQIIQGEPVRKAGMAPTLKIVTFERGADEVDNVTLF